MTSPHLYSAQLSLLPLPLTYTAPGPVSNIMVTPNDNGTVATITWTAPPLSPGNKDVDYIVNVSDASGNVVSMTTTNDTTVTVTQGLGKFTCPYWKSTQYTQSFVYIQYVHTHLLRVFFGIVANHCENCIPHCRYLEKIVPIME